VQDSIQGLQKEVSKSHKNSSDDRHTNQHEMISPRILYAIGYALLQGQLDSIRVVHDTKISGTRSQGVE
jgi:hypothetical protein